MFSVLGAFKSSPAQTEYLKKYLEHLKNVLVFTSNK